MRLKIFFAFLLSMLGALLFLPFLVQGAKTHHNDLWPEIAQNITLHYQMGQQAQVDEQIRWYVRHPKTLYALLGNAKPYLYYVYQQIQQRHLPAELSLVPIIESSYNPFAQSTMGASGLWQIMPETAADYGLKMTQWFDGRLDVQASTKAALDHFSSLHSYFGDWLLAIAAYDAGAGTVRNTILQNQQHHQATDVWSLSLPSDAKDYVIKYIALATIIKDPKRYHINLPRIANEPFFATYALQHPANLNQIAHATKTDMNTIRKLNPGYNSTATVVPQGNYALLIPKEKAPLLNTKKE